MKLSVVIPAHNEADSIDETVERTSTELERAGIEYEILVIDDASGDGTAAAVESIAERDPNVRCVRSQLPPGFGHAVRAGLDLYTGDAVAIMMADLSDSPKDLVLYYRVLEQGYDCAFGTRFGNGGNVYGYPRFKLIMNRIVNTSIRVLFQHGYNDTTNAFKAYRRHVIDQLQPLLSNHFNLTVELPLKAVVRGFSYAVVPVTWTQPGARDIQAQAAGDGQPLPVHRALRVAGVASEPGRLPPHGCPRDRARAPRAAPGARQSALTNRLAPAHIAAAGRFGARAIRELSRGAS